MTIGNKALFILAAFFIGGSILPRSASEASPVCAVAVRRALRKTGYASSPVLLQISGRGNGEKS
jgi:hypothetical protein